MVLLVYDLFNKCIKISSIWNAHRVFLKLREIKGHRYSLIIIYSMHVVSFSHQ